MSTGMKILDLRADNFGPKELAELRGTVGEMIRDGAPREILGLIAAAALVACTNDEAEARGMMRFVAALKPDGTCEAPERRPEPTAH